MAKVEIDEEELLRNQQLTKRVGQLLANPKAALLVEEALKMVDPNAPTPRLDAKKNSVEPVEAITKEFKDYVAQQEKDKADEAKQRKMDALNASISTGIAQLKREGWTPDGIKGVEALMEEKGILDPMDAAAIYEKAHPPQVPVTPHGSGAWNFMSQPTEGQDDLKKLIESRGENEQLLSKMTADAINEVRGSAR